MVAVGLTGFTMTLTLDRNADVFYAVALNRPLARIQETAFAFVGAASMEAETVRAWGASTIRAIGEGGVVASGSFSAVAGVATQQAVSPVCNPELCVATPTALQPNTPYRVFIVAAAASSGTLQAEATVLSFQTADDSATAPNLDASARDITSNSFVVDLKLTEVGVLCYWVVRPDDQNASGPVVTSAQVEQRCAELRASNPLCPFPDVLGPFDGAPGVTLRRALSGVASGGPSGCDALDGAAGCPRDASPALVAASRGTEGRRLAQTAVTGPWVELGAGLRLVTERGETLSLPFVDGQDGAVIDDDTLFHAYSRTENPRSGFKAQFTLTPVRTLDITPPDFVNATPRSTFVGRVEADFDVQLNEAGTVFWAQYLTGTGAPSTASIVLGENALAYGMVPIAAPFTATPLRMTGLTPATCYDVFFGAEDDAEPTPNRRPDPAALVSVCTPDDRPPEFVTFEAINMTSTRFDMSISIDETGKVVYMVIGNAALCDAHPRTVNQVRTEQRPTADPLVASGVVDMPVVAQPVLVPVSPTTDNTVYTIYMFAQDLVEPDPNVQDTVTCWEVRTPDLTPPTLTAAVTARLVDALTMRATVDEPADVFWVLLKGCATVVAGVTPQQVRAVARGDALPATIVDPASFVAGGVAPRAGTGGSVDVERTGLDPASEYRWLVAAEDTAASPNLTTSLQDLRTTTLDQEAPVVEPDCVDANVTLSDVAYSWDFVADEPAELWYVLTLASDPSPSADQICQNRDASNNVPIASGAVSATGSACTELSCAGATCDNRTVVGNEPGEFYGTFSGKIAISGLTPKTSYRLHVVVEDKATPANAKTLTTTGCPTLAFTTLDLQPPVLEARASITVPSSYLVEVRADEVATAKWILLPDASPVPSVAQVWGLQDATGTTAVFGGTIAIPRAAEWFSIQGCGIQASVPQRLFAVAEDANVPVPNRVTSVVSAAVPVTGNITDFEPVDFATCTDTFLTRNLRVSLRPAAASAGFALGSAEASMGVRSRRIGLLQPAAPGAAVAVEAVVGGTGAEPALSVPEQGGAAALVIAGVAGTLRVAAVDAVLRLSQLSPEAPALSIRYLVKDKDGRVQVTTALLGQPVVELANSATGPRAEQCGPGSTFDAATGFGTCSLTVQPVAFPSAGSPALSTTARLRLTYGTDATTAVRSPELAVTLAAAPAYDVPADPGIELMMPTRSLLPGEEFTVTVTARTGGSSLLFWSVPVYYDATRLVYRGHQPNVALWAPLTEVSQPASGYVAFNTSRRAAGVAANDTSGTNLLLFSFTMAVAAGVPAGSYANALRAGDSLNPVSLVALSSNGRPINVDRPLGQINDSQGGARTAFLLRVRSPATAGVLAWAESPVLANTAVLDGVDVGSDIRAVAVSTESGVADVAAPGLSCSRASEDAPVLSLTGCRAVVSAIGSAGSALVPIAIASGSFSATVGVRVFFPTNVRVVPARSALYKIIDLTDPTILTQYPGVNITCTDPTYQSTEVAVLADFASPASGAASAATVSDVDVSSYLTVTSSDAALVEVIGNTVLRGRGGPGTAQISVSGVGALVRASADVSTVAETECISALEVVAFTAAAVSARPAGGVFPLDTATEVSVTPRQLLTREGQAATLRANLVFADGTRVDVTSQTRFESLDPGVVSVGGGATPSVAVAAAFGSASTCGLYVRGTFSVCGADVITGLAPLKVLPATVQSISTFDLVDTAAGTRTVARLTRTGDLASIAPLSVDVSARLRLLVALSDGSVFDLSSDLRVTFTVTSGTSLIKLTSDAAGTTVTPEPGDKTTGVGVATIRAATLAPLPSLSAEFTVTVAMFDFGTLVLRDYDVGPLAEDDRTTAAAMSSQGSTLRAIECTTGAFQQATVWAKAVLTDGSRHEVTEAAALATTGPATLLPNLGVAGLSNRLRPTGGGAVTVEATLAGQPLATLPVTADAGNTAQVATLSLSTESWCAETAGALLGLCRHTVGGSIGTQRTVGATLALNTAEYATYTDFMGAANEADDVLPVWELLTFTSSNAAAVEVVAEAATGRQFGDFKLAGNSPGTAAVTLTATYSCAGVTKTATTSVYSNLTPQPGDVDLGVQYGPQFHVAPTVSTVTTAAPLVAGTTFDVPVVVSAPTGGVTALQLRVSFTGAAVSPTLCTRGANAGQLTLSCDFVTTPNQLTLSMSGPATSTGSRLHLATVTFTAEAAGTSDVTATIVSLSRANSPTIANSASVASTGRIAVVAARRSRSLAASAEATVEADGGALDAWVGASRSLEQACDQALHEATPGDVDGSCTFDEDDWRLVFEARNYWNPGEAC